MTPWCMLVAGYHCWIDHLRRNRHHQHLTSEEEWEALRNGWSWPAWSGKPIGSGSGKLPTWMIWKTLVPWRSWWWREELSAGGHQSAPRTGMHSRSRPKDRTVFWPSFWCANQHYTTLLHTQVMLHHDACWCFSKSICWHFEMKTSTEAVARWSLKCALLLLSPGFSAV